MTPPFVLIVEDNAVTQSALTRDLGALDFRTHVVPSAEDAWDHLNKAPPPDIIVLDYHLPGEDGPSLYRKVSLDPRFGNVAVIPFTALADMKNDSHQDILTLRRGTEMNGGGQLLGIVSKGGSEEVNAVPGALLLALANALRTINVRCPPKLMAAIRDYLKQFTDDASNDPMSGWAYFLHLDNHGPE
jgi:CheY-like chemotaxis protein